jgi:hypothetical protein
MFNIRDVFEVYRNEKNNEQSEQLIRNGQDDLNFFNDLLDSGADIQQEIFAGADFPFTAPAEWKEVKEEQQRCIKENMKYYEERIQEGNEERIYNQP